MEPSIPPHAKSVRCPDSGGECLAGRGTPDLHNTRLRSTCCYLWRSDSFRSRLAMLGAHVGLHVRPTELTSTERPAVLAGCPGAVARLDEQVIDPVSFLADL